MNIICESELINLISVEVTDNDEADLLYCWYAGVREIDDKKMICLMNAKTGYSLFFYNLSKKQLEDFSQTVKLGLALSLQTNGLSKSEISTYLSLSPCIKFLRKDNKQSTKNINDIVELAKNIGIKDNKQHILSNLSLCITWIPLKINNEYVSPSQLMRKSVKDLLLAKASVN